MDEEKERYEKNMERIRAQKREALPRSYEPPPYAPASYAPPPYAPPPYAHASYGPPPYAESQRSK